MIIWCLVYDVLRGWCLWCMVWLCMVLWCCCIVVRGVGIVYGILVGGVGVSLCYGGCVRLLNSVWWDGGNEYDMWCGMVVVWYMLVYCVWCVIVLCGVSCRADGVMLRWWW